MKYRSVPVRWLCPEIRGSVWDCRVFSVSAGDKLCRWYSWS